MMLKNDSWDFSSEVVQKEVSRKGVEATLRLQYESGCANKVTSHPLRCKPPTNV